MANFKRLNHVTYKVPTVSLYVKADEGNSYPQDGSLLRPFNTVQEAIAAAAATGASVKVAAGTYTGPFDFGTKDITVEGDGAGSTILTLGTASATVTAAGVLRLSNCTVKNTSTGALVAATDNLGDADNPNVLANCILDGDVAAYGTAHVLVNNNYLINTATVTGDNMIEPVDSLTAAYFEDDLSATFNNMVGATNVLLRVIGRLVLIDIDDGTTADGGNDTLTSDAIIPAAYRPGSELFFQVIVLDNGALVPGMLTVGADGTLDFSADFDGSGFTDDQPAGWVRTAVQWAVDLP